MFHVLFDFLSAAANGTNKLGRVSIASDKPNVGNAPTGVSIRAQGNGHLPSKFTLAATVGIAAHLELLLGITKQNFGDDEASSAKFGRRTFIPASFEQILLRPSTMTAS